MFCNTKRIINEIKAAITGRRNHPIEILPAISHCTSFPPLRIPIPMTAPTTACELETGTRGIAGKFIECKKLLIPCEANRNNTIEWANTTTKLLEEKV